MGKKVVKKITAPPLKISTSLFQRRSKNSMSSGAMEREIIAQTTPQPPPPPKKKLPKKAAVVVKNTPKKKPPPPKKKSLVAEKKPSKPVRGRASNPPTKTPKKPDKPKKKPEKTPKKEKIEKKVTTKKPVKKSPPSKESKKVEKSTKKKSPSPGRPERITTRTRSLNLSTPPQSPKMLRKTSTASRESVKSQSKLQLKKKEKEEAKKKKEKKEKKAMEKKKQIKPKKSRRMASLNAKAILEASFSFEKEEKRTRSPPPPSPKKIQEEKKKTLPVEIEKKEVEKIEKPQSRRESREASRGPPKKKIKLSSPAMTSTSTETEWSHTEYHPFPFLTAKTLSEKASPTTTSTFTTSKKSNQFGGTVYQPAGPLIEPHKAALVPESVRLPADLKVSVGNSPKKKLLLHQPYRTSTPPTILQPPSITLPQPPQPPPQQAQPPPVVVVGGGQQLLPSIPFYYHHPPPTFSHSPFAPSKFPIVPPDSFRSHVGGYGSYIYPPQTPQSSYVMYPPRGFFPHPQQTTTSPYLAVPQHPPPASAPGRGRTFPPRAKWSPSGAVGAGSSPAGARTFSDFSLPDDITITPIQRQQQQQNQHHKLQSKSKPKDLVTVFDPRSGAATALGAHLSAARKKPNLSVAPNNAKPKKSLNDCIDSLQSRKANQQQQQQQQQQQLQQIVKTPPVAPMVHKEVKSSQENSAARARTLTQARTVLDGADARAAAAALLLPPPRRPRLLRTRPKRVTTPPRRRLAPQKEIHTPAQCVTPPPFAPGNMTLNALKKRAIVKPLSPAAVNGRILQLNHVAQWKGAPKWSNGWTFEGTAFEAKLFIKGEDCGFVRRCFPAMRHESGDLIRPRDCVLLKSGPRKTDLPFVAKVAALWENPVDGEMMFSLLWYYRPEHTDLGRQREDMTDEIFASKHRDANSVATIEDKCHVLTLNEYCRFKKRLKQLEEGIAQDTPLVPSCTVGTSRSSAIAENFFAGRAKGSAEAVFFCRRVYDFKGKRMLKNPA